MANTEIRVYSVNVGNLNEDKHHSQYTNEEFMTLAEDLGDVFTLNGFAEAYNSQDLGFETDVIRFISV